MFERLGLPLFAGPLPRLPKAGYNFFADDDRSIVRPQLDDGVPSKALCHGFTHFKKTDSSEDRFSLTVAPGTAHLATRPRPGLIP
jgi:hypothetical protein